MMTFFATFGHGHAFSQHYVGIIAEDGNQARQAMFKTFGQQWAFVYSAPEELTKQVTAYKIRPLAYISASAIQGKDDLQIVKIDVSAFGRALELQRRFGLVA